MYLKELKKHSRASIIKIGLLKKFVLSDISQPSKFGLQTGHGEEIYNRVKLHVFDY